MDKNIPWNDWGPPTSMYIPAPSVYPCFLWILLQRDWSKGCKERPKGGLLVATGLRKLENAKEKHFGIGELHFLNILEFNRLYI